MKWSKLLSSQRYGVNAQPNASNGRTQHEADVDRISFSGSFRRLAKKTQVHPLAANDHIHTRLTHSIEVARIGRAIGSEVARRLQSEQVEEGVDFARSVPSILEAACLAHDIGNPPLGHAGEEAMRQWLAANLSSVCGQTINNKELITDLLSVEGNAQGFRVLTCLENHIFDGGLRLTAGTLATFLKYPYMASTNSKKFSVYESEKAMLSWVANETGLLRSSDKTKWLRHPLAHLVECADDICYSIIDLDDAVELKILTFGDVKNLYKPLFSSAEFAKLESTLSPSSDAYRVNMARLRGWIFDKLVAAAVDAFFDKYHEIMRGEIEKDLIAAAFGANDPCATAIERAKQYCAENVFSDRRKVEIELGSFAVFDALLSSFTKAAVAQAGHLSNNQLMGKPAWGQQLVLRYLGDHSPTEGNGPLEHGKWDQYHCLRRVLDFVCGMTDNYATFVAKQLSGAGFSGSQRP